ncbi:MAG TPA: hypothetical protein VHA78_05680 [Candidatus Peribacteraceae bacterium]|nr:hypothetical protein [Candidatus Peribacteraceae bacterium]
MTDKERIYCFVDEIWAWYARHKRVLPWRDIVETDDTQRAYKVFVSEIMLQQTQVPRVVVIFRTFLERFPAIKDLANASNKDVILAWKGMGYNSRALRLRDAARVIMDEHNGIFPREYDELLSIKGIGPYTAAAIRNFAFNIPTPCIDTNIRRILHRTFVGPENADGTWEMNDKKLLKIAEEVLTVAIDEHFQFSIFNFPFSRDSANWHAALMDFGSLVQTKSNPKWDICPLTEKGIMKAKEQHFKKLKTKNYKPKTLQEPGRFEGARYVPNRIFRGRIVDALREHDRLTFDELGPQICSDWNDQHRDWLQSILQKLVKDDLLAEQNQRFTLKQ